MAPNTDAVPVLVLSGAVGTERYLARRLKEADIPHALVDHEWLASCWPVPVDDPWNENVAAQNLGCLRSTFHAAGAQRLIYCRVPE